MSPTTQTYIKFWCCRIAAVFGGVTAFTALSVSIGSWFGWMEYSSEEYYHGAANVQEAWGFYSRFWLICGVIFVLAATATILLEWTARRHAHVSR